VTRSGSASDLVRAAEALEQDLQRLEELTQSVRKMRLHTDKSIARAARELEAALAQQGALAQGLRGLGEAMVHMQERQQAAIDMLRTRAMEIQQRTTRMTEHMQRFAALGTRTAEVADLLQPSSGGSGEDAAASEASGEALTKLVTAEQQLTSLAEEARSLAAEAEAEDFTDIAREADAMKQRVQATRHRLETLIREHAAGTS
jgi:DNA repair exonuclease SbcCD ATPase subunit